VYCLNRIFFALEKAIGLDNKFDN